MKPIHLALLAVLATPLPAMAQAVGHEPTSTADGLGLALSTDVAHRYVSPRGVGFSPENVPSSALSPIPPNVEQIKHAYALGEASLPDPVRVRVRRARPRRTCVGCRRVVVTTVRTVCPPHRSGWATHRRLR